MTSLINNFEESDDVEKKTVNSDIQVSTESKKPTTSAKKWNLKYAFDQFSLKDCFIGHNKC